MNVKKKFLIALALVLILSMAYIASGFNNATIYNSTLLSVVDSKDALVAVPDNQILEIINGTEIKMTIINNTTEKLAISVPIISCNGITIEGKESIIEPGNQTSPNFLINIGAPDETDKTIEINIKARNLLGDFYANIKSKVKIVKHAT